MSHFWLDQFRLLAPSKFPSDQPSPSRIGVLACCISKMSGPPLNPSEDPSSVLSAESKMVNSCNSPRAYRLASPLEQLTTRRSVPPSIAPDAVPTIVSPHRCLLEFLDREWVSKRTCQEQ